MSDTIVDSSVVAKWILPEADSAQAQRLITEVVLKGERLIVVDLAFCEVANAIWKRHHRGLATLIEARQFLDEFLRSPIHSEASYRLLTPALEIAIREAVAIDEESYGAEHSEVANDLTTLAEVLRHRGAFEEVENTLRKALGICRKSLPRNQPLLSSVLGNLTGALLKLGRSIEAENGDGRGSKVRRGRAAAAI